MLLRILLYLLLASAFLLVASRVFVELYALPRIFKVADVPISRVAIVFGAGLRRDGYPTPVLQDRVATAAQLYFDGKVEKLLMSGDNRFVNYNEPGAMFAYATSLGVPAEDIVLDYAGRRTYDTCYRAKAIFGVEEAILVTQRFHLPRAVFLCNAMGIKGHGVIAETRTFRRSTLLFWNLREVPATLVALWEIWVTRPLPVLGEPEPIFGKDISFTASKDK